MYLKNKGEYLYYLSIIVEMMVSGSNISVHVDVKLDLTYNIMVCTVPSHRKSAHWNA